MGKRLVIFVHSQKLRQALPSLSVLMDVLVQGPLEQAQIVL